MSDGPSTTGVEADAGTEGAGASAEPTEGTVLTGDATTGSEGAAAEGAAATDGGTTGTEGAEGGAEGEGGQQSGEDGQTAAPETYADFALPEGVQMNDAVLTEAAPLFKEMGLNQEQAQKFVDLFASEVQAGEDRQVEAFNQLMTDWREKSANDQEFGGDKFEESVGIARSAIDKFGTPELKQLLEDHGVGNHPEVIRFMVKVGRLTNEDVPGSSGSPTSKAEDRVSILYPTKTA